MRLLAVASAACALIAASACSGDTGSTQTSADAGAAADVVGGDVPVDMTEAFVAHCSYVSAFTELPTCREYRGTWDPASAEADCAGLPVRGDAVFALGVSCEEEPLLGRCIYGDVDQAGYVTHALSSDSGLCARARTGCENYGSADFEAAEPCLPGNAVTPAVPDRGAFVMPYEDCRAPLEGEPVGASDDGAVCTDVIISGSTEEGRRFVDYASCDVVRTQRPYAPRSKPYETPDDDPRLADADYMAEMEWVTEQVRSSGCVCCHSVDGAPSAGTSDWWIEAGPLWIDTVDDSGVAMFAGLVDSSSLGVVPPVGNNGFDRSQTGLPTTDVERMQAFMLGELERRGVSTEDAEDYSSFGGPFVGQVNYEPGRCEGSNGFGEDGSINFPSAARYVYVLEVDAANPGVPPNLNLPEGTLWRLDVPATEQPIRRSVVYGEVPEAAFQRAPFEAAAPQLEAGTDYYIYVLADVIIPIMRCIDTWPG